MNGCHLVRVIWGFWTFLVTTSSLVYVNWWRQQIKIKFICVRSVSVLLLTVPVSDCVNCWRQQIWEWCSIIAPQTCGHSSLSLEWWTHIILTHVQHHPDKCLRSGWYHLSTLVTNFTTNLQLCSIWKRLGHDHVSRSTELHTSNSSVQN